MDKIENKNVKMRKEKTPTQKEVESNKRNARITHNRFKDELEKLNIVIK